MSNFRRWQNYTLVPFELTKEDFLNGRKNHCRLCPGTLAINRGLKIDLCAPGAYGKRVVEVHSTHVNYIKNRIHLPAPKRMGRRLREFVKKFDRGDPEDEFELPFKFKLRVPDEMLP